MTKHNWFAIELEFEQGLRQSDGLLHFPTYDELALKYNIRPGYLRTRAAKAKWREKRGIYQAELERQAREEGLKKRAEDINRINKISLDITKEGFYHLGRYFNDLISDPKAKGPDGKPLPPAKMPLPEIEAISRAGERFQKIAFSALGLAFPQRLTIAGDSDSPLYSVQLTESEAREKLKSIAERAKALQEDLD